MYRGSVNLCLMSEVVVGFASGRVRHGGARSSSRLGVTRDQVRADLCDTTERRIVDRFDHLV